MRLREMIVRGREVLVTLGSMKQQVSQLPDRSQGSLISGAADAARAANDLLAIPLGTQVHAQARALLANPILQASKEPVLCADAEWSRFQGEVQKLNELLSAILTALGQIATPVKPHEFTIRLPPLGKGGLDDLSSTLKDFSKAIEQPIRRLLEAEVVVTGVDRGTDWLTLLAHAPEVAAAVKLLVEAWQGYVKHKAEIRLFEAHARQLNAGAEVLEGIAANQKLMRRKWQERESRRVVVEIVGDEKDPRANDTEVLEAVRLSISTGARLLEQGAAVDFRALEPGKPPSSDRPLLEAPAEMLALGPGGEDDDT